jgi:hypothetical protein
MTESSCCNAEIADDPSYHHPPDDVFWTWLPRIDRRAPKSGQTLLVSYRDEIDTAVVVAGLRKNLRADSKATAASYFSGLGMSCRPSGPDIRCERTIPASLTCVHLIPRPADYDARYHGGLYFVVVVSSTDIVKSTRVTILSRIRGPTCPSEP